MQIEELGKVAIISKKIIDYIMKVPLEKYNGRINRDYGIES